MSGYIELALTRFLYLSPKRPQHLPFAPPLSAFGKSQQLTPFPDASALLNAMGIKSVKKTSACYYTIHGLLIRHCW